MSSMHSRVPSKGGSSPTEMALGQQHARASVAHQPGHPLARVRAVDRHVDAARVQSSHYRCDEIERAVHHDRDAVPDPHACRLQTQGERVRTMMQLAIRHGRLAVEQRATLRRPRRLRGEVTMDRARRLDTRRVIPRDEYRVPLSIIQRVDLRQCLMRVGDRTIEQRLELAQHALDALAVEEIGGKFGHQPRRLPVFQDEERQVEHRAPRVDVDRRDGEAVKIQWLSRRILRREHHLKERGVAQRAIRAQRRNDALEGHILMIERFHAGDPNALEQRRERGISAQVRPNSERVDEQPDHILRFDA